MSCDQSIPLNFLGSVIQGPPGEIRNTNALLIFSTLAKAIEAAKTMQNEQQVDVLDVQKRFKVLDGVLKFQGSIAKVYDIRDFAENLTSPDGVASAISSMIQNLGYVLVPSGAFPVGDISIDAPLHFLPGGSFDTPSGAVCTIRNAITSPRQWIFGGDGEYSLTSIDSPTGEGENARQVHASWFGAFPSGVFRSDAAPRIHKAFASMGNARESIVDFDMGNYWVSSNAGVTRCGWVRGDGTRRTVFRATGSGFDVFTSLEDGAKWTDIQFETVTGLNTRTSGAWIRAQHNACEIENISAGRSKENIILDGNLISVSGVRGVFGEYPGAGSSLVSVRGGAGVTVRGVKNMLTNGPDELVEIGGPNQTKTISSCSVDGVSYDSVQSIGVRARASIGNLARVTIRDVSCNTSSAGAARTAVVSIEGEGSSAINGVKASNLDCTSGPNAVVRIKQTGSGTIEDISLSLIDGGGGVAGTFGIDIERTSGILRDVFIDSSVNVLERETPLRLVGVDSYGSNIKIAPNVKPNTNAAGTTVLQAIPNNTAVAVPLYSKPFIMMLLVAAGSNRYGTAVARAAAGPTVTPTGTVSGMTFTTGVLTGTTGADGTLTVGIEEGMLYFENRTGAALNVSFTPLIGFS